MAAPTTDGTEQDPPRPAGDLNGTPGGGVGEEEAARGLQDPKQEPGDNEDGGVEMDGGGEQQQREEEDEKPPPVPGEVSGGEAGSLAETGGDRGGGTGCEVSAPEKSPGQGGSPAREPVESLGELKPEQREEESVSSSSPPSMKTKGDDSTEKTDHGIKRRASVEISSSDGEPLSRMDSEDSISSTLMDLESTASSGRSTPAMMNGHGGASLPGAKASGYTCCWDLCQLLFTCSPDLAEHIRSVHVDGQRGGVFVCLWKGCKVYNTPSTSQSWLQRHMLTHSGDKPFKCVVGGCNATFASQGGLARHVPTHFSSQGSSKLANQSRVKEESPSKAGLNKRRKLKNKRRRSLPRPHDFFDAQTMDAIRHRAICLNLATHIESLGNGHSVVFHSTVIARRKEESGKVKVLLHWTPEDILPDAWVNEAERSQQKTKVVHLSQLPTDTTVLLDPNIYRMFF